jgi:RNA polymerase sigma-B factor
MPRKSALVVDVDDDALFRQYAETRDRVLRNEIVERHLGLAAHIAKRYTGRSSGDDD